MDALRVCLFVFAGVTLGTWLVSVLTREYSWVDRIWSIVPVAYVGIFAGAAGFADTRLDVMFALVALWGARLTFNFARKGGYAPGGEDYRWAVLRERMAPWQFQLFNFFFISLYQNAILLLITLPALTALEHPGGFGVADVVVAVVFAAFLAGETVADQQQWEFHPASLGTLFDAGADAVVCCAANVPLRPLTELTDVQVLDDLRAKLLGQVALARRAARRLSADGSITLTGGTFTEPIRGSALVNAGLEGFVRSAAAELPRGPRINVVSPGWISETLEAMGEDGRGGTPVAVVAEAYRGLVEGDANGRTVVPR
jgi:hypothetical protein